MIIASVCLVTYTCIPNVTNKHVTHTTAYIILNEYTHYHSVKILLHTQHSAAIPKSWPCMNDLWSRPQINTSRLRRSQIHTSTDWRLFGNVYIQRPRRPRRP